jgi:hypothetical protein
VVDDYVEEASGGFAARQKSIFLDPFQLFFSNFHHFREF